MRGSENPSLPIVTASPRTRKRVWVIIFPVTSPNSWYPAALALEALHKQVLPFLLRRLKEDVLHDLPPKIIQDYYCELSDLQKHLYDDFAKSMAGNSATESVQAKTEGNQQHIFQSLQYLRKLCNHPALVLKQDETAITTAFSHIDNSGTSNLSDIQHAPKLLALKYAFFISDVLLH